MDTEVLAKLMHEHDRIHEKSMGQDITWEKIHELTRENYRNYAKIAVNYLVNNRRIIIQDGRWFYRFDGIEDGIRRYSSYYYAGIKVPDGDMVAARAAREEFVEFMHKNNTQFEWED